MRVDLNFAFIVVAPGMSGFVPEGMKIHLTLSSAEAVVLLI